MKRLKKLLNFLIVKIIYKRLRGNFIWNQLEYYEIYGKIAEDNNCYFVDNNGLETGIDKVHYRNNYIKNYCEENNINYDILKNRF